ncbi:hypothetical protein GLOTRDRAFT_115240 [Gloeophyllum trabeum ATCC 11539]|uniref:DASH complex subunit DUO1 n=1 Tax=Gloeophyllum trabeum (strain ATCC 11539 / FP-39264 / Madison 617) TaxID=670483 RepID=S7QCW9_GLOTA|nr:uncharacterized protein GLOTRDRAFT_115240 [Gloeophyllum trabeum ATCC 11539]EPQ57228.1 hypothetical protein GLOTRDRAFT_115240 [Gloeophyllum trabeum ATCC 11539]
MYSEDSLDITIRRDDPHLMSESPLFPSQSSNTGPGGDDLSLSELSLNTKPAAPRKRFSLFAQPPEEDSVDQDDEDNVEGEEEDGEEAEKRRKSAARTRDEKLQHDLFLLRKLNSAFSVYNEALREAKTSTETVSAQLQQTDALLDKYVNILSKSHSVAGLIFDEKWHGAEVDQEELERELEEAEARARQEEEERARAEQLERERLEREEQERKERQERARLEQEKRELAAASRGRVTGVRGTRASMRGARASSRAASTSGAPGPRSASGTGQTGIPQGVSRSSSSLSRGSVKNRGRWS